MTGGRDENYLVGLLETAAGYTERPLKAYEPYFGLSAKVWRKSTEESLDKVFGNHSDLHLAPPVVFPGAAPTKLGSLAHFINCHGADGNPAYFGEAAGAAPTRALRSDQLKGKVKEGTVVSVECCYGAQLYNPSVKGEPMGMCNAYLAEKAYAVFGSSTVAYGPAEGNDVADLICHFFLKRVREGSSLGRACLQARIDYAKSGTITPTALKTLAQFNLLGDPSLVPVQSTAAPTIVKAAVKPKSMPMGLAGVAAEAFTRFVSDRMGRGLRRTRLRADSNLFAATATCVGAELIEHAMTPLAKGVKVSAKASAEDRGVGAQLTALVAELKLKKPTLMVFGMQNRPAAAAALKGLGMAAPAKTVSAPSTDRVHVMLEREEFDRAGDGTGEKIVRIRGFEAVESNGILQIKKFVSR